MKYETVIDKEVDPRVVIYARERTPEVERIEKFVGGESGDIIGYLGENMYPLSAEDIFCVSVSGGEVIAHTAKGELALRERLYAIEESLGDSFVRINKSCIASIRGIERFETTLFGSLSVLFKDGYRDYVSRRQLKSVKEKFGIKLINM